MSAMLASPKRDYSVLRLKLQMPSRHVFWPVVSPTGMTGCFIDFLVEGVVKLSEKRWSHILDIAKLVENPT